MDPAFPPPPLPIPPPSPASGDNWWGRNWKWFVPVGCLGTLLLFVAFIAMIASFVFGAIKSSDAYRTAVARAQSDPWVAEALGTPLKPGLLVSGSINVNGAGGHADLAIPVTGSKGEGTIYAVADKVIGEWKFSTLTVQVKANSESIDLTGEEAGPRPR